MNAMESTGVEVVSKLYQHASYWDLYSSQVLGVIVFTIIIALLGSYFWIAKHAQQIQENWATTRCDPWVLPFVNWITNGKVSTSDNFQYCTQNILINMMGYVLAPFQYLIAGATGTMEELGEGIQMARTMTATVRSNVSNITEETLGKILNFLIPIQTMSVAFMDTMQKIQGILVSGLFTTLGTYYALQSVLGAVLDFIIKILLALVIVIVGLWLTPVTWPVAATTTAVFSAVAIPMAVISVFMTEVMHIPVAGIPKLRCFGPETPLLTQDGKTTIRDCQLGDILEDGGKITAKLCLDSRDLDMYDLDGILISGIHHVFHTETQKWIPTHKHPRAKPLHNYPYHVVYCINTTTKQIPIREYLFADWDELYDTNMLQKVLNYQKIGGGFHPSVKKETIYRELNSCFPINTPVWLPDLTSVPIQQVRIGQPLMNRALVYGVVWSLAPASCQDEKIIHYHLLTTTGKFITTHLREQISDYNGDIDVVFSGGKAKGKQNLEINK
jgi:hypothetical protein